MKRAPWTGPTIKFGGRPVQSDAKRSTSESERMLQPPYLLDDQRRAVVLKAIRQHCEYRGWNLLAAHVRNNHVHAVLEADVAPEKIVTEFKAYASRELNRLGYDAPDRKRWARHGSTRWLFKDQDVRDAIHYVIEEQGQPMALFLAETL
jgi:REP element-mobilizing transposase RayT